MYKQALVEKANAELEHLNDEENAAVWLCFVDLDVNPLLLNFLSHRNGSVTHILITIPDYAIRALLLHRLTNETALG